MLSIRKNDIVTFDVYYVTGVGWQCVIPDNNISEKTANRYFQEMKSRGMIPAKPTQVYTVTVGKRSFGLVRFYRLSRKTVS